MLTLKRHVAGVRTPLLVPSFSSKSGIKIKDPTKVDVDRFSETIASPVLISAYDIFHGFADPPTYSNVIFLDSGGYEALQDFLAEKRFGVESIGKAWDEQSYQTVLRDLQASKRKVVVVSYDHPREPLPLKAQLDRADRLFPDRDDLLREFLIKPEPSSPYVEIDVILSQLDRLVAYPVIGLTDKELGATMMERLIVVGKLRLALKERGFETPIHIFGSLDPITSPLYFLAGADVFDGLAWLRYGFSAGRAIYPQNFDAVELDLHQRPDSALANMWTKNYLYLVQLEDEMRRFLLKEDFGCFGANAKLLERARSSLDESLKE